MKIETKVIWKNAVQVRSQKYVNNLWDKIHIEIQIHFKNLFQFNSKNFHPDKNIKK